MKALDVAPEEALAGYQVDGLVVALYRNERPLQGLAARIDWRLRGALSRAIHYGKISAEPGEVTLLPIRKQDRIYQILLAGAGDTPTPGQRAALPEPTVARLRENLAALGKFRWALSESDLGPSAKALGKHTSSKTGAELWVTQ